MVAVKTGLFTALILLLKKGWKLVALGVAAAASSIKRLFTGRKPKSLPAPTSTDPGNGPGQLD